MSKTQLYFYKNHRNHKSQKPLAPVFLLLFVNDLLLFDINVQTARCF